MYVYISHDHSRLGSPRLVDSVLHHHKTRIEMINEHIVQISLFLSSFSFLN